MMKIDIKNRQTGKTTNIAKMMKANKKSICIVPNMHMKKYLCSNYKLQEDRVFTLFEVTTGCLDGREYDVAFMDEIGICLQTIIPKIVYGTHTNE